MIPEYLKEIMTTIEHNGYEIYLVGGVIRDYLLKQESIDYDLTTNASLEKIAKLIPDFHLMSPREHRNTGVIFINNKSIEITEFRGKTITEDLSNRDYTIDAFAMDKEGTILDPLNAINDLQEKKLKLVKEDGEGLITDPLRILRAFRIADRYDLDIDPKTKEQLLEKRDLLKDVAKERIYKELMILLIGKNPTKYLREYKKVFFEIIPELQKLDGFEQHNKWHLYDVFEHTMIVIENTKPNPYLRLAALFHDIGKPEVFFRDEEGVGHFYGHQKVSLNIFRNFAKEYKLDKETRQTVGELIYYHDGKLSTKRLKIKELIKSLGPETIRLLFELKKADNLAQNPELATKSLQEVIEVEKIYQAVLNEQPVLTIKELDITGKDLIELGYSGQELGTILRDLLKLVMCDQLTNNKEILKEYVIHNYSKGLKKNAK